MGEVAYWIVRDEGDSLAYWGPFATDAEARDHRLFENDGCDAIVPLRRNPDFLAVA